MCLHVGITAAFRLQYMPVLANWYLGEFEKKGLDRPMRIATVGWDNAYGRGGLEATADWAQKQEGVEFVAALWFSPMTMDYTSELMVLKEKEVDAIAHIGNGGFLCRDAAKVGLPEDVALICCPGSICTVAHKALAGPEMSRAFSVHCYWEWGEDKPFIKMARETQMSYHGDVLETVLYIGGWSATSVLCEGARRAVGNVGYENLTGEAIKEGLDSIKDWDNGSGGPVSFGDYPKDCVAQERFRIVSFDMGTEQWVPIRDWIQSPGIYELE